MTAHNSRKASNSRNESNNRYINTVWTPPKAGMLAKTVKPSTAWREANSSRDNRNITASTAVQASAGTPTAHYGRQHHILEANSTILDANNS